MELFTLLPLGLDQFQLLFRRLRHLRWLPDPVLLAQRLHRYRLLPLSRVVPRSIALMLKARQLRYGLTVWT